MSEGSIVANLFPSNAFARAPSQAAERVKSCGKSKELRKSTSGAYQELEYRVAEEFHVDPEVLASGAERSLRKRRINS